MRRVEEDTYVLCEQHLGLLKASRPLMFGRVTIHEEHTAGADDECYMCTHNENTLIRRMADVDDATAERLGF